MFNWFKKREYEKRPNDVSGGRGSLPGRHPDKQDNSERVSISSVLKVNGVLGEREYLERLRCSSGHKASFERQGSFSVDGILNPVDRYVVHCAICETAPVAVHMDMYHKDAEAPTKAPHGFTLEHDNRRLDKDLGSLGEPRSLLSRLLKRDFGIDVLLVSGDGTWDDPHKLAKCSADVAALTQAQAIRGLGKGTKVFQRVLDWSSCEQGRPDQVISIECIQFTEEQIITETRRIYFDTRNVDGSSLTHLPLIAWRGTGARLSLPFFISWLHFDGRRRFMDQDEEAFTSLEYSGPGAKAKIVVYDAPGRNSSIEPAEDIESIVRAKLKHHQNIEDPWETYRQDNVLIRVLIEGDDCFYMALPEIAGPRIRMYLTIFDDPKTRKMAQDILKAFAALVGEKAG